MKVTREKIESAVKEWQNRLNLNHWIVRVRWDLLPSGEDAGAAVFIIEGRDYASIRFEHNILDEAPEVINQWIAHELIHIHVYELYNKPYIMLNRELGEAKMVLNFLHDEIEKVVDRLATAFAKEMPLPASLQESDSES